MVQAFPQVLFPSLPSDFEQGSSTFQAFRNPSCPCLLSCPSYSLSWVWSRRFQLVQGTFHTCTSSSHHCLTGLSLLASFQIKAKNHLRRTVLSLIITS